MQANFYRAFEDRHRGSRELILSRLRVYLPFILPIKELEDTPRALDLGCGRGEWLQLLKEYGFDAFGVDLDDGMLEACAALGLATKKVDALAYLQGVASQSLQVVSGFHIVEHLPFEVMTSVVVESLRVLTPGGLLILETPNPENILVGSKSFYLDPTHEKPIPPELLLFTVEHSGFYRSKIIRLQEDPDLKSRQSLSLFNVLSGASPDYSIVSQKSGPPDFVRTFDEPFSKEYGITLDALATAFTEQVDGRVAQSGKLAEQAQDAAEDARLRASAVEARASQAEATAGQAEARASQAEAIAGQAGTVAEQSGAKANQTEARAERAEARVDVAEKKVSDFSAAVYRLLRQYKESMQALSSKHDLSLGSDRRIEDSGGSQVASLALITSLSDRDFIDACYWQVLRRLPDPQGMEHYLSLLRGGADKIDIIGRIRYSAEGRRSNVKIPGLFFSFVQRRLCHLPIVGRVLSIFAGIWNLPSSQKNARILENRLHEIHRIAQELENAVISTMASLSDSNDPREVASKPQEPVQAEGNLPLVAEPSTLQRLSPRAQKVQEALQMAIDRNRNS